MKNELRIVIFGKPASGKGTQARLLVQKLKLPLIAGGDLLRREIKKKTKIGGLAGQVLNHVLTPDQYKRIVPDIDLFIVTKVVERGSNGFILDGVPRNLDQAKLLETKTHVDFLVVIKVSDQVVLDRLAGRRYCSNCGAVYHLKNRPPSRAGLCDQCEGRLVQRDDDREEYVKFRLEIYRKYIEPIIGYYRNRQTIIIEINGEQAIQEVLKEIYQAIRKLAT